MGTSIRYCSPINVTIATKGEAMMEAVAASGIKQFYLPDDPNPARSLHCNDMTADTSDSKAADWWSANSYKYITAGWTVGLCPAAKYPSTNNEYHPVDGGSKVTLRRMGKGSVVAMLSAEDEFYLHAVDKEDHKCFEASSSSKFASKGITDSGKCPASYNTVDKSVVVEQCPDGVTSIRYCSPINVTIDTKGEAMVAEVVDKAQCSKDTDCPSSYCNNGFCHGCFDKCCQTTSDCTKKGLGYCQNDSTKMPPYFCHA